MGAGASSHMSVPEKIDMAMCEELAGESFKKEEFLAQCDSDGFITSEQLMEYCKETNTNLYNEKGSNDILENPECVTEPSAVTEADAGTEGFRTDDEESEDESALYMNIKPEFSCGMTLGDLLALESEPEPDDMQLPSEDAVHAAPDAVLSQ